MSAPLIGHIGILVPNLEDAIQRWTAATGYTFSPIGRYRTSHYCDKSNPDLHWHDARISVSKEGPPRIELMEATGSGTHALSELGVHHFGIGDIDDVESRRCELAAIGIGDDGRSYLADGSLHLWFTDKAALDGVRLEFISRLVGPTVADDGSPLGIDPATGRKSLWLRS
jgi:catechol 2,3-dioxygenase-like lactoylglutathione lyase family enzyme